MRLIAGPWHPVSLRELFVAQAGVVARPSARAGLPRLECLFRRAPFDQWRAILVAKIHPAREIEENVEIGFRFSRGLDRLVRNVHRAIHIGETAGLFAP